MLTSMLKRLVRRSARVLQRWAEEPPGDTGPMDAWAAPYTLNPLFVELVERDRIGSRYTWPAIQSAHLSKRLDYDRVSFIEFGVAGGNGLLNLEQTAERLEARFGIGIDVYGFDTGTGLPRPKDYRDLPNLWSEGAFRMDVPRLEARLTRARLMLGPVSETVPKFLATNPSPVAFVSFDMDFYSSTMDALALFDADPSRLLPRVHCYLDDILGYTFCEFNGERLAIADFNAAHTHRKVAAIPGLRHFVPERFARSAWWERYFLLHIFDHELYTRHDGTIDPANPILTLKGT
jgi:hypothetical protein